MQHQTVSRPVSLVCVGAPADAALLAQWETHLLPLQQAGLLTCWSERHLQAGDDRQKQFSAHLAQAECVVLLLSADFFADTDCMALMHEALLRQQQDHLRVIPLLVRPVEWQESALGAFPCLPSNGIAVTTWEHPDAGWQQATQGMRRMLGRVSPRAMVPLEKRATTDRERMLHLLRRTYQTTLDGSLQGIAWLALGLAEHPNAVRNATHLLQHFPDQSERVLPAGASILDAYDQAEEALLILGDPGAGKSTLLLDLALRLLVRAEADERHPLPVILPLSSWAVNKPMLTDWLVEQLARIYDVPRKLGRSWVNQGQILPLLDGLDEMEGAERPRCIAAVNTYRTEHFTPQVVCSRSAEYHAASTHQRLLLQNAVVVQPLSQQQIEGVIQQGGEPFAALREALRDSQDLRDLTTTPLMLSILVLAYHGTVVNDLPHQRAALEHRVWTDYVERMVREKGTERQGKQDLPVKRYALEQTRSWLGWLAQQMRMHNQTLFYGESLLEGWLPASQQRAIRWLVVYLPAMLLGACASFLLWLFLVGSTDPDPAMQCQVGLIGGFLGWCLRTDQRENASAEAQRSWWRYMLQIQGRRLLRAGGLAILVAATFGLDLNGQYYRLSDWVRTGIIFGSSILVGAWLLQVVLPRLSHLPMLPLSRPTSRWTRLSGWLRTTPARQALWTATILGTCIAISSGVIEGMSPLLGFELGQQRQFGMLLIIVYPPGLIGGLIAGLSNGLIYGGTIYLVRSILDVQSGTVQLAERVSWTWHNLLRFRHLRTSLIVALACLCFFSAVLSIIGLSNRQSNGLSFGLSFGLSNGLSFGLSYWLLLGLYQGMTQEHLEGQDRRRFNQGLHRSLRNRGLLSLLGAGIIAGIGVLSNELIAGLTYGLIAGRTYGLLLSEGLSYELSIGLHYVWLFLLYGWLVLWAATGGLTILRHYTLRLLLARSHTFPLRARRFLDDASARVLLRRSGSGYGFVHRRLLDYFADATLLSADASEAAQQAPSEPQSLSGSLPRAATLEGLQDT